MSSVLKSMRLDNYVLKSYYKTFAGIYVLAVVVAMIFHVPALAGAVVMIVAAPFAGVYFSVYEKDNLSKLYGILPLGKSDVVVGRYLYTLLFGVTNGTVSGVLALVLSLLVNGRVDGLTMDTVLFVAFLYFCLFVSIMFPIYFRYPFSKVYIYINLPFYLTAVLVSYILRKTDFLKHISQAIQYFSSHPAIIWVTGIGVGLVLLAVSCSLSCQMYGKAEL